MSVSALSRQPSLPQQPREEPLPSEAIAVDQTPNAQEVLDAEAKFNSNVLQEILGFPPEKYWSDLPLHDVCYLAVFKVFCDFYGFIKKPLQEKAFFSFSYILSELNRTSCVTDEWVDWLEEEASEIRTDFSLPTKFSSHMHAICNLLRNPNHSLSSPSSAHTLEIRAQGLAYFAKLQKAAYDISLPFQKNNLDKAMKNLEGFKHMHHVFSQIALSDREMKETVKKLQLSSEEEAQTLAKGKICRSIFETLFQKIAPVLTPVVRYQVISIEELKIPVETTSAYAIAETMTKHAKKILSLNEAIQRKDREMYAAVETATNAFLPAIGPYAQEPTLVRTFKMFLGIKMEAQNAFFLQMETFLEYDNEEVQNVKNLEDFLDYIQMLDTHIYKGKKEELERKKALTKMLGAKKYHLSEKLCDQLIDLAIKSAEDFDTQIQSLDEQYHYSMYFYPLTKADSSPYFLYLKNKLKSLQEDPTLSEEDKTSSQDLLYSIFSSLVGQFYEYSESERAVHDFREGYEEIMNMTSLRENIEKFHDLRSSFTQSTYFCFGFLSRFLPKLIEVYEQEQNKSIDAYIQTLSSLPKKLSSRADKVPSSSEQARKGAPASPSSKENVAPSSPIAENPPSLSPIEEFFFHFMQISPNRLFESPSKLKASAVPIQQLYHFLLYILSEDLLRKLALQEIDSEEENLCQKEALFSSSLHASHMVMELGLTRLRMLQQQAAMPIHALSHLARDLVLPGNIRKYCHQFPTTNLQVRYPYTHTHELASSRSSFDLLSDAQVHFHEGILPLMEEIQKHYGTPSLQFSVFSERHTASPKEEISKKADHLLQVLSPIIDDAQVLLLSSSESELKNSVKHLIRLKGLTELLKEAPSQRNYLFFLHQMTSSMQHTFEITLLAYSNLIGLPLQTHNLESYMDLFRVEEENILSKEEIAFVLHFNTKKALDYPLASLCEHGNAHAKPLWDAFVTSSEAFFLGEGFTDKKKPDMEEKYLSLLEDIEKGLQILEKISQKILTV